MRFITMAKSDYETLEKNIFKIYKASSGNIKGDIIEFGLLYFGNEMAKKEIKKGLKFFKKVKANISKNAFNQTVDALQLLEVIIIILKKY